MNLDVSRSHIFIKYYECNINLFSCYILYKSHWIISLVNNWWKLNSYEHYELKIIFQGHISQLFLKKKRRIEERGKERYTKSMRKLCVFNLRMHARRWIHVIKFVGHFTINLINSTTTLYSEIIKYFHKCWENIIWHLMGLVHQWYPPIGHLAP